MIYLAIRKMVFAIIWQDLISLVWAGVQKHMIRNILITLGIIANETAPQKEVFDSLTKVVLVNWIALGYILVEHGGIFALVNCCSRAVDQGIKMLVMQDSSAQPGTCSYLQLRTKQSPFLSL